MISEIFLLKPCSLLLHLLALATCNWSDISLSGGAFMTFVLSLTVFLFLFFPDLFKELFGFGALFGLINFIFGLWGFLVSLLILRVETYL